MCSCFFVLGGGNVYQKPLWNNIFTASVFVNIWVDAWFLMWASCSSSLKKNGVFKMILNALQSLNLISTSNHYIHFPICNKLNSCCMLLLLVHTAAAFTKYVVLHTTWAWLSIFNIFEGVNWTNPVQSIIGTSLGKQYLHSILFVARSRKRLVVWFCHKC